MKNQERAKKESIILFKDKTQCCGCGACVLVCPTNSIKMKEQELGCMYPIIDDRTCIKCHKCQSVCGYKKELVQRSLPRVTYVAVTKKKNSLRKSSSGGVFCAIAETFLKRNGVVFGCSMEKVEEVLVPMHIGIRDVDDLVKLQGSKYVQSRLGNTYEQIKNLLLKKEKVLFSGTPCQVAALKTYLGQIDISSLYTIDIICHGVPSEKLFQDYLNVLSKKINGSIIDFLFRDKTFGWGLNARVSYKKKDRCFSKIIPSEISSYYSLFLDSEIYRESCYSCKYANLHRVGDITIGDFWCVEKEHEEYMSCNGGPFDEKEGISCLMVNTEQGNSLIRNFGKLLNAKESEVTKVAKWNHQLQEPSKHTNRRKRIVKLYSTVGYSEIEKDFRRRFGVKYYIKSIKNMIKMKGLLEE